MRSPSIFQDLKFLHKPNTQVSSFLSQSNFSGKKIEISNKKNNSLCFYGSFLFQNKNQKHYQIFLVFSSFESKNLHCALNLFKKFTLCLASQYETMNCFQKTYKKLLFPPSIFAKQKPKSFLKTANQKNQRCDIKLKLANPPIAFAFDTTSHPDSLKKASCVLSTVNALKKATPKMVGLLRALRIVGQPFHPKIVPQSSSLITVIKSPHVFKKTREQFALTICKSVVKLDFKNSTVASLFLNSFFLLKFPCEVKVILKTI
uniref:Ribosomal protein S10 n=1 Tax=Rhexinema sarcinoideum TaxID=43261 RepID=A0A1B2RYV9_9CHLO|nr:ribosomal protein S10 [Rhexinema sarcinoideum]